MSSHYDMFGLDEAGEPISAGWGVTAGLLSTRLASGVALTGFGSILERASRAANWSLIGGGFVSGSLLLFPRTRRAGAAATITTLATFLTDRLLMSLLVQAVAPSPSLPITGLGMYEVDPGYAVQGLQML